MRASCTFMLISSPATGAQNATTDQRNMVASTTQTDDSKFTANAPVNASVSGRPRPVHAQDMIAIPVTSAAPPEIGANPSVESVNHSGCGCRSKWSNCPRPIRRLMCETLYVKAADRIPSTVVAYPSRNRTFYLSKSF